MRAHRVADVPDWTWMRRGRSQHCAALGALNAQEISMISVLFVDDEPNLRAGLKRMFQKRQGEWLMRFAASGAEALEMLVAAPADVVVSDMAMPEMSGAELLARIKRTY